MFFYDFFFMLLLYIFGISWVLKHLRPLICLCNICFCSEEVFDFSSGQITQNKAKHLKDRYIHWFWKMTIWKMFGLSMNNLWHYQQSYYCANINISSVSSFYILCDGILSILVCAKSFHLYSLSVNLLW